jgi:curved DNA-binding protein
MSHYATLGLDEKATQDDIKKAYRSLSKKYHPDVNPEGEAEFKKIVEAYSEIGDESKRKDYDARQNTQSFFDQFNSGSWGGRENLSDMFNQVFGNAYGGQARQRGADVRVEVHVSFNEAIQGTSKTFELNGGRITVDFKPGLKTGQKFRLNQKGNPHPLNSSLPNGDLILNIHVIQDSRFILQGDDIWIEHSLPWWDIMLGTDIIVLTPYGNISIKVPEGSYPGKTLRIKEKGFPIYGTENKGYLLCRLNPIYPELSDSQIEYINKIKNIQNGRE